MKTFKRTYLPEYINYNGKRYTYNVEKIANANMVASLGLSGCVCVEVLSRNLKGKLDLHNQPYKASKHIFTIQ